MHNLKTNFDKIFHICKYVLDDELLEDGNFFKYKNSPKMTDIEIVTLSLTADSLSIDSENLLFSKLKTEYINDFPNLVDRSNYNRRRKKLMPFIAQVSRNISALIDPKQDRFILDSIPIPICQNPRISRTKICKDDTQILPSKCYHASHKIYYYGFKLQLIISKSGIPVSLGVTSANVHDVNILAHLNDIQLTDCELIADKGYLSLGYQTSLFEEAKIKLITPLRANMDANLSQWTPKYRYHRKRIETLFSQLCDQMLIKRNYAKSFNGLFTRICSKLSAVAVLQYVNFQNKNSINKIKHALAA
jgi:Transposase DDE domain